jgi:RHH-type proline utilization regulon transcriptional repressor/proline dehydrogenase/delta 1-pyrroline-5-carboxylate dehydrogenase
MSIFRRHRTHESSVRAPAPATTSGLEAETLAIGAALLDGARGRSRGLLSGRFWSDGLMNWSLKDPQFKLQLFRFIDTFPALRDRDAVYEHLVDYLSQPGVTLPAGMSLAIKAGGAMRGTFTDTIAGQVRSMAGRFIAGSDAGEAMPTLRQLWDDGVAFSVDLLGEASVSDAEAAAYLQRYVDLLNALAEHTQAWPASARLERDHLGPIPRVNVSVKISALSARINVADYERTLAHLTDTIAPLLEAARRHDAFVNFDMEQHALKDLTIGLFTRCCERFEFQAGLALQAYLRSVDEDAMRLIEWTRRTGRVVTVRLIKGAYWDQEVASAELAGWPCPVWTDKRATDASFERAADRLIAACPRAVGDSGIKLAIGTHNARSIAHVLATARAADLPDSAVELQMLRGMADELKQAAVEDLGLRVREYVPVGQLVPGMAYLVRRLLENTSNESWLRGGLGDADAPVEQLLADPSTTARSDIAKPPDRHRHALSERVEGVGDGEPFFNEPVRDFADADQREGFAKAVAASRPPAVIAEASESDAHTALAAAAAAFPAWRDSDPVERAKVLTGAAAILRQRRDELAAVEIHEAGKPWREADADVCEAIDFCEYYARQAVGLFTRRRIGRFTGELDETVYQPRGVCAVISPWNFPMAICCGMTVAALVTGNTVIVKPAEQTPAIAKMLCDALWQAGAPRDVLQFLPGTGETVGALLVRDRRVATVAFTGSKAVGLDILAAAGRVGEDQLHLKRVVCEMGGKNAIVIDESADLDEAVLGVRSSAFGFAGQKCSACSRVIVHEACYDRFVSRLVDATRALVIGDPLDPGTDVGPVIDAAAKRKIAEYIEIGQREGTLALAMEVPDDLERRTGKPFVGPHVFTGIESHHRLANEEVFGPVLAVMRARTFDEALAIANGTGYKLTGGVYTRKPSHIERAKREYRIGNLYINRGITGALVARHPFGGLGLSGGGTKAGGSDYLLHFVEPRAIAENTMRRGFAPDVG